MCTRVYTIVYPRVHYCIHACTLSRSKYVLSSTLVCTSIPQLTYWAEVSLWDTQCPLPPRTKEQIIPQESMPHTWLLLLLRSSTIEKKK